MRLCQILEFTTRCLCFVFNMVRLCPILDFKTHVCFFLKEQTLVATSSAMPPVAIFLKIYVLLKSHPTSLALPRRHFFNEHIFVIKSSNVFGAASGGIFSRNITFLLLKSHDVFGAASGDNFSPTTVLLTKIIRRLWRCLRRQFSRKNTFAC